MLERPVRAPGQRREPRDPRWAETRQSSRGAEPTAEPQTARARAPDHTRAGPGTGTAQTGQHGERQFPIRGNKDFRALEIRPGLTDKTNSFESILFFIIK